MHVNCDRGCRMVLHHECWKRYSEALEGLVGADSFDKLFKKGTKEVRCGAVRCGAGGAVPCAEGAHMHVHTCIPVYWEAL